MCRFCKRHFSANLLIRMLFRNLDSSDNVVYRAQVGRPGFDSRQGTGIFLFDTASRPALGATQLRVKLVPGALSPGVKRSGREADHSPHSKAEVKNALDCTSTFPYAFVMWYLVNHRIRLHGVVLR
jgi:hypothetical protein